MPQNAKSGARANKYGLDTSRLIAKQIGALSLKKNSNEFSFEGRLITIRCAHKKNAQVGVLYSMLDKVDSVIAALEVKKNVYDLYEMTPSLYKIHIRDSKKQGRLGLVRKLVFEKEGKILRRVRL